MNKGCGACKYYYKSVMTNRVIAWCDYNPTYEIVGPGKKKCNHFKKAPKRYISKKQQMEEWK